MAIKGHWRKWAEYDERLIVRLKPGNRIYTIENGYTIPVSFWNQEWIFTCIYAISDTLVVELAKYY